MQLLMRKIWDTAEHAFFVDSICRTCHNINSKETFVSMKATILSYIIFPMILFHLSGFIPMGLCTDRIETGENATARSRRCRSYFPFSSQTVSFFFLFFRRENRAPTTSYFRLGQGGGEKQEIERILRTRRLEKKKRSNFFFSIDPPYHPLTRQGVNKIFLAHLFSLCLPCFPETKLFLSGKRGETK